MPMSSHLLQRAIQWSRAGNKEEARAILRTVIQQEPGNQMAWFWYADTLASEDERIAALEQFLLISPGNPAARKALATLYVRRDLGLTGQSMIRRAAPAAPERVRAVAAPPEGSSTAPTQPVRVAAARRAGPRRRPVVDTDAKGIRISYRTLLFLLLIPLYLFVVWSIYTLNNTPTRAEFESLYSNYSSLQVQHANLQQDYNNLTRAAVNLLAEREALKQECTPPAPVEFPSLEVPESMYWSLSSVQPASP